MITYAKGNAALAQLGHWLGEEDFLAGVNRHLTAHAFGNADLADFLDSLDSATDLDVRAWAAAWLRSTGFDTLRGHARGDGRACPSSPARARGRTASPCRRTTTRCGWWTRATCTSATSRCGSRSSPAGSSCPTPATRPSR